MNLEQTQTIFAAVLDSLTGGAAFPQTVERLRNIGVERYHADYARGEKTFYLAAGESIVVASPWGDDAVANDFNAAEIEAAVRRSQRGQHTYPDFIRETKAAGCVGYFVQITGRRALYFGRNGETHVELFPTAPAP
jgi:uncharacterized protein YbcV (DUF1398 family)